MRACTSIKCSQARVRSGGGTGRAGERRAVTSIYKNPPPHPLDSNKNMGDDGIADRFTEVDPNDDSGSTLRTLVDFELTDADGNFLSLDEIGEGKKTARAVGVIVEPLSSEWRQTLLKYASSAENKDSVQSMVKESVQLYTKKTKSLPALETAPSSSSFDVDAQYSSSSSLSPRAHGDSSGGKHATSAESTGPVVVPPFDRSAIKVGDLIDGYCIKTFKWYGAKVTDMKTVGDQKMVKVHFQGWKSRYDEWIEQLSERLVAAGTSSLIMYEAAKQVSEMVPWFDSERLNAKVEATIGKHKALATQRIEIPCIEDWCIDLTYCNPSLWLIASTGVWYRVAGPLCPGGVRGKPTKKYEATFAAANKAFLACSHVAMCLLDFFPSTPKITLQTVMEEIAERTKGSLREGDICNNHELICTTICSMSQPDDWDPKLGSFENSVFLQQLKRQGPAYVSAAQKFSAAYQSAGLTLGGDITLGGFIGGGEGGEETTGRRKRKSTSKMSAYEMAGSDLARMYSADPATRMVAEAAALSAEKAAAKLVKYPMEDKDFWDMEKKKRIEKGAASSWAPPPLPLPSGSSRQLPYRANMNGKLLSTWASYLNFRYVLHLPHLGLEEFESLLLTEKVSHPLLVELHVSLLAKILVDRGHAPFKLTLNRNALGNDSDFDVSLFTVMDFDGSGKKSAPPVQTAEEASKVGLPNEEQLRNVLRTGDAWVEVLRVLVAERNRTLLPEYYDPLNECLALVGMLMQYPEAALFCQPVDPLLDDVPNYHMIVQEPMDLATIRRRILSGWYDTSEPKSFEQCGSNAPSSSGAAAGTANAPNWRSTLDPRKAIELKVGDLRDVFCQSMERWCQARVVSIDQEQRSVLFRFKHLGELHDERVEYDQLCIAVKGSKSRYHVQPKDRWLRALAARSKKPPQLQASPFKTAPPSTEHGGHLGVLKDVRQIWENCHNYYKDGAHPLCARATLLSEKFEDGYARRVTEAEQLIAAFRIKQDKSCSPEDAAASHFGARVTYCRLPFESKLLSLSCAFDEFCGSNAGRTYLDEIAEVARYFESEERSSKVTKKGPVVNVGIAGEEEEEEEAVPMQVEPRESRVVTGIMIEDLLNRKGYKRMNLNEGQAALSRASAERVEVLRRRLVRLNPMGRGDRDDRQYWTFTSDSPGSDNGDIPRLFVEDPATGEWLAYASIDDINRLYQWLEPKAKRESKTRDAIRDWMEVHSIPKLPQQASTPKVLITQYYEDDVDNESGEKRQTRVTSKRAENFSSGNDYAEGNDFAGGLGEDGEKMERRRLSQEQQFRNVSLCIDFNYRAECWSVHEHLPTVHLFKVHLSFAQQSLGLACRDINGLTIVTGFNFVNDTSPVHAAGIRVGDRLCVIGNHVTRSIPEVKEAMNEVIAEINSTKGDRDVNFLVMRFPDPFADISNKDAQESVLKMAIEQHEAELQKFNGPRVRTDEIEYDDDGVRKKMRRRSLMHEVGSESSGNAPLADNDTPLHPLLDQIFANHSVPSHLVGLVVHILINSVHPYITSYEWAKEVDRWVVAVASRMVALRDLLTESRGNAASERILGLESQLVRVVCDAMLRLEDSLSVSATKSVWRDNQYRYKFKWRKACSDAKTMAQASLCVASIQHVLRLESCKQECKVLDKKVTAKLIEDPYFARHICLQEGATVVYYGDGHAAAESAEVMYKAPKMWGASAAPFVGQVFECRVAAVRLFKCGSKSDLLKKSFPFAQIDLTVMPLTIPHQFPPPAIGQKLHARAPLNRILGRILACVGRLPEAGAFQTSVPKMDLMSFTKEIGGSPIFLNNMRAKVHNVEYTHPDQLLQDMLQIHRNIQTFYRERNPDLVTMCDLLVNEMKALLAVHQPDFDAAAEEGDHVDSNAQTILQRKKAIFQNLQLQLATNSAVDYGAAKKRKLEPGSMTESDSVFSSALSDSSSSSSSEQTEGSSKMGIPVEKVRISTLPLPFEDYFPHPPSLPHFLFSRRAPCLPLGNPSLFVCASELPVNFLNF